MSRGTESGCSKGARRQKRGENLTQRTHPNTLENQKSNRKEQKLGVSCQGPVIGDQGGNPGLVARISNKKNGSPLPAFAGTGYELRGFGKFRTANSL